MIMLCRVIATVMMVVVVMMMMMVMWRLLLSPPLASTTSGFFNSLYLTPSTDSYSTCFFLKMKTRYWADEFLNSNESVGENMTRRKISTIFVRWAVKFMLHNNQAIASNCYQWLWTFSLSTNIAGQVLWKMSSVTLMLKSLLPTDKNNDENQKLRNVAASCRTWAIDSLFCMIPTRCK